MSNQQLAIMQQIFSQLPEVARQRALATPNFNDAFAGGISAGFAVLSIRGKAFRIKYLGEETQLMERDNQGRERPFYSIEVVLVAANPHISKTWYEQGYVEGSTEMPDCFSNNGMVPDPGSPKLQNSSCLKCKWNQWGSSRAQGGSGRGKDCSDNKRIAVVPAGDLNNEAYGGPMLLRFPPASLGEVMAYSKSLQAMKIMANAIVTELSFDPTAEYPKLTLAPRRPLTNDEYAIILEHEKSETTDRILASVVSEVENYGEHSGVAAEVVTSGVTPAPVASVLDAIRARTGATAPSRPVGAQQANPATPPAASPQTPAQAPPVNQGSAFQAGGAPPPHDVDTGELLEEEPDPRRATMRSMGMSEERILKVLGPAKMRKIEAPAEQEPEDPRLGALIAAGLSEEEALAAIAEEDGEGAPAQPEPAPTATVMPRSPTPMKAPGVPPVTVAAARPRGRPPAANKGTKPPVAATTGNGASAPPAEAEALAAEVAPMPPGFEDVLTSMIGKNKPKGA